MSPALAGVCQRLTTSMAAFTSPFARCGLHTASTRAPIIASGVFLRGQPALRPQVALLSVVKHSQRQARDSSLSLRAIASAEPSTVKIITQGRHVEVTPAIKNYVVRS